MEAKVGNAGITSVCNLKWGGGWIFRSFPSRCVVLWAQTWYQKLKVLLALIMQCLTNIEGLGV